MDPVTIGTTSYGSHWLDRPAAASWFRMVRDGCPAAGITDAGRTQQEQITVFTSRYRVQWIGDGPFGDVRWWNGSRYVRHQGAPVAVPGSTQARHTCGRALDLNGATKAWVRANGHRYGWIKDLVRGEDWHIEYQPASDVVAVSNPGTSTGGSIPNIPNPTPIDPIEPEDDFMSALTAEEQREALAILHTLKSFFADNYDPAKRINRVGDTQAKVDLTYAQVTNAVNGIVTLLGRPGADVDEAALAKALVPLLSTGSDATLDQIAKAVQDEADRRERERLGT